MSPRLPPRPWMTHPATRAVIAALEAAGGVGCARFVGGCVRDTLLGRDEDKLDIDIATPLTPDQVTTAIEAAGLKAVPTGVDHGTITAVAKGRPYEITTLRRDVETDGRRAVVAFTEDWAEDASRRDFRLNALYAEPDGSLHDPTGGGIEDARAGRIIFVGDPETRIREDYLRILRFFRFFAGYGRGEADGAALAACAALKDGLAGLSGERVSKELLKLLAAPDPRAALALMQSTGALSALLPAVEGLYRVNALVEIDADPELRLAALLPDDRTAVATAAQRLRLSNTSRNRLLAACSDQIAVGAEMTDQAARIAVYRLGGATVGDRFKLAWAATGGDSDTWRRLIRLAQTWTPPDFPITGADIKAAGVREGPRVGEVRRTIEAWWLAGDFTANRAAALAELRALLELYALKRPS